jgi:hypothetical protein
MGGGVKVRIVGGGGGAVLGEVALWVRRARTRWDCRAWAVE